jgi:protein-disulfide isomerase
MAAIRSTAVFLGILLCAETAQASLKVAVLPLDARLTSGRMDPAARASLDELLLDVVSGALAHEDWVVLSDEKTQQALRARGVAPEACDGACRIEVARALDTDDFVSGAVEFVDGRFTLSIRVIETGSGSVRATEHMEGRNVSALRRAVETSAHRLFVHAGLLGPAIAGNGTLRVDSAPQGAEVLIGGESIGNTPLKKSLAAGKYEITIQHEGYEPHLSEATVRAKADTSIFGSLSPRAKPAGPAPERKPEAVFRIPVGASPVRGAPTAKVTIVEWSDFECPYCAKVQPALRKLEETFGKDLRIVFKNYPLRPHKHARLAAEAALAAAEQGKFWEMHDELFQNRARLERLDLEERGFEIGLDMKRFEDALDNHRFAAVVERDQREGDNFGVTGTPMFFVNGRALAGNQPFDSFKAIVTEELAHADRLLAAGTAPDDLYEAETKDGLAHADVPKQPRTEAAPGPAVTARVDPGDSPARGSKDALVTIVEWSDFQCPYCARVKATLESLLQTYPQEVRLVFKHAPLGFHPNALPAALAAEAARAQGKFWEFHDALFQHQADLSPAKCEDVARDLHLNPDRFARIATTPRRRHASLRMRPMARR